MVAKPLARVLVSTAVFASVAEAHHHPWWNGNNGINGNYTGWFPPWWNGTDGWNGTNGWLPPWANDTNGGYYGIGGNNNEAARFFDMVGAPSGSRVLIAHAVVASAVWVLLIPTGGILLRLNINSPWILRLHAALQILSYLAYIAAVGLGIWLVQRMSFAPYANLWNDPHPRLGLAILALAFFQPILGIIHHRLFKKRLANEMQGKPGPTPGRTTPGHMHLWLGRVLIILGIINGGLGIRLASRTPFQSASSTRKAAIVYGVIAGVVALVYLAIVARFEIQRLRRNRAANNDRVAGVTGNAAPASDSDSQYVPEKLRGDSVRYS